MKMISGLHYDFLYWEEITKKVTCTLVSDAAGINHRCLQCFTCEVHRGRMVQCCQFGRTQW